ncbi:MAG: hypothetical protein HY246_25780, partial [Proteobacteria bacterium]|nr:hypothetical protein [Pseudomonadota bacterium]
MPTTGLTAAETAFSRLGFAAPTRLSDPDYELLVYPKQRRQAPNLKTFPNGDFIFACGTLIYRRRQGDEALDLFYQDISSRLDACESAYGHYAVVLRKGGATRIFSDALGSYHVFYDAAHTTVSSSFLAVASVLPRVTVATQGVYEFVFDGVVSGSATLFDEIRVLPKRGQAILGGRTLSTELGEPYRPSDAGTDFETLAVQSLMRLNDYFDTLVDLYGGRISSALSGGYDSRLILALLRRRGVTPQLYVYGRSEDVDVRIAKAIAVGEGIPIDHIDKDRVNSVPVEAFAQVVERNFYASDGYLWEGVFDNGAEHAERFRRTEGGMINLNGGGGEAFRNFFYLRNRPFTKRQLLWSFYGQFDPRSCTGRFDEERHYRALEEKFDELIGHRHQTLDRRLIEWLYPNFRCRSFMGRSISVNNWTGNSVLPFYEFRIVEQANRIPVRMKQHGAFEAEMIRRVHPRIAAYPSVYGHGFIGYPPVQRVVRDLATYIRPTELRRFTFRVKHRLKYGAAASGY